MNFPIMKGIKINEEQAKNWDVNLIREFLDSNDTNDNLNILREMFENGVIKVYKDKMNEIYEKCLEEL